MMSIVPNYFPQVALVLTASLAVFGRHGRFDYCSGIPECKECVTTKTIPRSNGTCVWLVIGIGQICEQSFIPSLEVRNVIVSLHGCDALPPTYIRSRITTTVTPPTTAPTTPTPTVPSPTNGTTSTALGPTNGTTPTTTTGPTNTTTAAPESKGNWLMRLYFSVAGAQLRLDLRTPIKSLNEAVVFKAEVNQTKADMDEST